MLISALSIDQVRFQLFVNYLFLIHKSDAIQMCNPWHIHFSLLYRHERNALHIQYILSHAVLYHASYYYWIIVWNSR